MEAKQSDRFFIRLLIDDGKVQWREIGRQIYTNAEKLAGVKFGYPALQKFSNGFLEGVVK